MDIIYDQIDRKISKQTNTATMMNNTLKDLISEYLVRFRINIWLTDASSRSFIDNVDRSGLYMVNVTYSPAFLACVKTDRLRWPGSFVAVHQIPSNWSDKI